MGVSRKDSAIEMAVNGGLITRQQDPPPPPGKAGREIMLHALAVKLTDDRDSQGKCDLTFN
jgi:hypothetical protein